MISNSFKTLKNSTNPVTLQCTFHDKNSLPEFSKLLNLLSLYGFHGIELNLPDLKALHAGELHALLHTYELSLTYIATGVYARNRGLSLSAANPELRRKSIEGCKENILYAADFGAGIIIGYLKNHPEPEPISSDRADAIQYLQESLAQLDDFAKRQNVPILLEATNRYESCVANSLADTCQIAMQATGQKTDSDMAKNSMLSILPDTYHMNIEESHPLEALDMYKGCYRNIHLSDNNRYFPGLGCLAFENYLNQLNAIHYQGTFGIEGMLKNGIAEDLDICVNYLGRVMESAAQMKNIGTMEHPERTAIASFA